LTSAVYHRRSAACVSAEAFGCPAWTSRQAVACAMSWQQQRAIGLRAPERQTAGVRHTGSRQICDWTGGCRMPDRRIDVACRYHGQRLPSTRSDCLEADI
jgi:hypothetical protein